MTQKEKKYWLTTYREFERLVDHCDDSAMALLERHGLELVWGDDSDIPEGRYGIAYSGGVFELGFGVDGRLELEEEFEIQTDGRRRPERLSIHTLSE